MRSVRHSSVGNVGILKSVKPLESIEKTRAMIQTCLRKSIAPSEQHVRISRETLRLIVVLKTCISFHRKLKPISH
ncbi:hypothetical protein TNCV_4357531 [Trichonephila clavipes]|nr:hypothetical protein TNCV_4357531 [Trichonephila clavipes]